MEKKRSLDILGIGNMGGSILKALLKKDLFLIYPIDTDKNRIQAIYNEVKLDLPETNAEKEEDILLLALKPQVLRKLWQKVKDKKPRLVISIAAGVTLGELSNVFSDTPVVRFMPNLAASVSSSVTAVAYNSLCKEEDIEIARSIAASIGSYYEMDESLFSAFTGLSGSGIAYVFEFLNALALAGVREGLSYPVALKIANDTLLSAHNLVKSSSLSVSDLKINVCSPSGTTIEGLQALKEEHFEATVMKAVEKASARSKELQNNNK